MDESRRCTATSKRSGEQCKRAAVLGAKVCSMHGGKIPRVAAAAARRVAAATYGLPVDVDPLEALVGELCRTAGHVAWLGAIVADLDSVMVTSMFGLTPSAWIDLYRRERDHLTKVARDCVSAGVEQRRVQIEEAKADLIAQAFRGFAVELGHDPADPTVRSAFRRHLALVRGEAA